MTIINAEGQEPSKARAPVTSGASATRPGAVHVLATNGKQRAKSDNKKRQSEGLSEHNTAHLSPPDVAIMTGALATTRLGAGHASATDGKQHAKSETKKSQSEGFTFLHEEETTKQQGKTRKKTTIKKKKSTVHASAADHNQYAKTETKKSQSEDPSYCEEDHEEHNHVQQVPDDVARRREMITSKKNMEVSGAGASSSSSLLEQTWSSTDGDLEDANHDQLYGAESPVNSTPRIPRHSESEESMDEEELPGAQAVNSEGVMQLSKGHITSRVRSLLSETDTPVEKKTSTELAPEGAQLSPIWTLGTPVEALHTKETTLNRAWYVIGIFLVVVVAAAVGVGLGVGLSGSEDDSRSVEGPAPTRVPVQVATQCAFTGFDPDMTKFSDAALARYEMLLEDFAAQVVPDFTAPVNPDDYCTPTNLALIWLASDDENSLYSEEQLRNRYILGIFHVATNGFRWVKSEGWLSGLTECQWFGVTCDDGGKITQLMLPDNGLESTIPSVIGLLSGLEGLYLPNNGLVGQVPTTIGTLSGLTELGLNANAITGTFPFAELSSLSNLVSLNVENNRLTGQLSPAIENFMVLENLQLRMNLLEGAIPSEIGGLARLKYFDIILSPNVNSSIPTEFGRLQKLQSLFLFGTKISGTLPTELGLCTSLEHLVVGTTLLSGQIPSQLGNLPSLLFLHAAGCDFSGTVPDSIFSIASLSSLDLSANRITGSIPSNVSMLTNLDCLDVSSNFLNGTVPPELCDSSIGTVAVDCAGTYAIDSDCTCCNCQSFCPLVI